MNSEPEKKYTSVLNDLKEKIRQARQRASISVNRELLAVYWEIGKVILEQKGQQGWGSKVIKQLATDLKAEFPDMKGFSDRNLVYMQTFAGAYPDFIITQAQPAQLKNDDNNQSIEIAQVKPAQLTKGLNSALLTNLSWYHHTTLLDKVKEPELRIFYIQKTIEHGWSRDIMVVQIESGLHKRQGALTHNFKNTLPAYQSELTQQLFKDPYQLDFIMLSEDAKERDLEDSLMNHVTKLLLELGEGFAFMGRQKKFEAGGKEFFIDLLFYHTKLRRHIVIELKIGDFEPEFVSKMNLYLGLVDDTLKTEHDEPAIGLILCKTKNKIVAEYALRDTSKPIGIAEYKINQLLPEDIKGDLPSIEEIEQKLDEEIKENLSPVDARLKAVKEKIKSLNTPSIQTECTHEILKSLFNNGLKLLYEQIIQKLNSEFKDEFLSQNLTWRYIGKTANSLDDLITKLNEEERLTQISEIEFNYLFLRFKRSGTEDFNEHLTLRLIFGTTWYGFILVNHNNQNPFIKKMYHEDITDTDRTLIIDFMIMKVLDRIEWMIEQIEKK